MGNLLGVLKTMAARLGLSLDAYRARVAAGEKWCTDCKAWQSRAAFGADASRADGLAAHCLHSRRVASRKAPLTPAERRENARRCYRAFYAANRARICAAKVARKRGVAPVPPLGREHLTEKFGGRCAYCPAAATTWDHIIPVSKGGKTEPGNIVPCCLPCNSSKNNRDLEEWVGGRLATVAVELLDVLTLQFESLGCPPEALRG